MLRLGEEIEAGGDAVAVAALEPGLRFDLSS
jgi:hypothetical protein